MTDAQQGVAAGGRMYAEVAVNSTFPHRQTFSYAVPDGMTVRPGHAAYVPFGRQTLQGIVLDVHDRPVFTEPEKIRELRSLIGDAPLLDEDRVAVAKWVAAHYLSPVFDAVALFLPPGFERRPLTIVHPLVDRGEIGALELTPRQRVFLLALTDGGPRDVDALRERAGFAAVETVITQLEKRDLVARDYTLARPRVGAKSVLVASLALGEREALRRVAEAERPKPSRRAALIDELLAKRRIDTAAAARVAGSRANLERLVRSGVVRSDRNGDFIELALSPLEARAEAEQLRQTRRAAAAMAAVRHLARHGDAEATELRKAAGTTTDVLHWLAANGVITLREEVVRRDPLAAMHVARRPPPALLGGQEEAARAIGGALDARRHEVFLLHGVTGSGKTEVYLDALRRCIEQGRRAIVMVPEIALTPQTVRRFRERFERVTVLHSGLTDGEMFDAWHAVAGGEADVVIGARSGVFAPQPDLGLVILDEEHEWTYKQHDPQPRYHARDVAIALARRKGAAVVLGSATPDLVSYHRATRGEYTLLSLPERIRPITGADGSVRPVASYGMPRIDVVDLREELRAGNRSMFSEALQRGLAETLAAGEQAILFLNRRGMAGHVQCRDCGFVPECSSCAVALTYHRQYDRLVCHQCNRTVRLPATCKQCGSPRIRLLGVGVEKVEAEAKRLLPHARLLRWDRDVTRTRGAHDRILAAFLAHEADILIGTQMLAKGLDLPAVTLVGVVNADIGLNLPDYRSAERTFQILTQVAGRAGRAERPGRVIIQTYTPDNYAIDAASRYDFDGFVARELEARRIAAYPPFTRLVRLLYSHTNAVKAREEALRVKKALLHRRAELGDDTQVTGPAPAYVQRLRGRWRWQLLLRGRDPAALVRGFTLPPEWAVDVDPVSLL